MASTALSILDPAVAVVAAGCAAAALRLGHRRIAALMGATGVLWLLGAAVPALVFAHRGPLIQLILTFPTGRLRGSLTAVAVVAGYLCGVLAGLWPSPWIPATSAVLTAVAAIGGYLRTTGHRRKAAAPALVAGLAFAAVVALGKANQALRWGADLPVTIGYDLTVVTILVGLTVALRFGRWTDAAVVDLVSRIDEADPVGVTRDLRRALGDPGLIVGYWSAARHAFVDDAGRTVDAAAGPGRRIARIDDDAEPVAVLVYDNSLAGESTLIAGAGAVLRIAAANARMRADVEQRVARLAAARQRIVLAAEEQRVALDARVAAGPAHRLAEMAAILATLEDGDERNRATLGAVQAELEAARRELHQFVNGIRPTDLRAGGLGAAIPALAVRAGIPVDVQVSVDRIGPEAEAVVYFLCSEALANIAKHSGADAAVVHVRTSATEVIVRVADDGRGGADPGGSGLRGIADRVEALGGTFAVCDGPDGGTVIVARVPTEVTT